MIFLRDLVACRQIWFATPQSEVFWRATIGRICLVFGAQELKQCDLYDAVYQGLDFFKNGIEVSQNIWNIMTDCPVNYCMGKTLVIYFSVISGLYVKIRNLMRFHITS